jgi:iron(III) transport system permease protein
VAKTEFEPKRFSPAPIERWRNLFVSRLGSPQHIIAALLSIILVYLIALPLVQLFWRTISWGEGDRRLSRAAVEGEFTAFHWREMVFGPSSGPMLFEPFWNTMVTGVTAAVFALLLGSILAWLVVRTDMPGKRLLRPILTLPYVVPAFAIALAWEILFKSPAVGGRPGLFLAVFGIGPPEWLSYGPVPIIITMAIHYSPFAFLLASGTLATLDYQMEESAEILGASRWLILRKITFPVLAPAMAAAFVLTFGKTIGHFALPYLLGGPVQYHTMSTMLFTNLAFGLNAAGYILAIMLIAVTAIVIYASARVLGGNLRRFETITGKGFKGQPTRLGKWRWPLSGCVTVFALLTAVFPIALLGYQTFMLVDGRYGFDKLTLQYWTGQSHPDYAFGEPGVLHNDIILGATWNTIKLALISSAICSFVGLVIGYIVVRGQGGWMAKLLDQISFAPFLFPAIAFAAMYLTMFAEQRGPIPALYGTFTLLVVISVIKRLPYSTRTGTSAVTQVGQELEEAAQIQGASWFRRFGRIIFPLTVPGLVAGMMVSFVGIMRELTLIIILITPATQVLMTLGLRYTQEDQTQLSNAVVLLVTVLTIAGELIVWGLGKGRLARLQEET